MKITEDSTEVNGHTEVDGHPDFDVFEVRHRDQLRISGVPQLYWETLHRKISEGVFDAGSYFMIVAKEDEEEEGSTKFRVVVDHEDGIRCDKEECIFLVDHAWTFRPEIARSTLESHEALLQRMCNLLNIDYDEDKKDEMVDKTLDLIWKQAQTYSIGNPTLTTEERMPYWYIMDEFGSYIQHSETPNFRLVPFYSNLDQTFYSLLFPIRNSDYLDEVHRDFLEGSCGDDSVSRKALMNIWSPCDLTEVDWRQTEPVQSFFEVFRVTETLPNLSVEFPPLPNDRPIKVYTTYDAIRVNLKDPRFVMVDSSVDADIIWINTHFKAFEELSINYPERRINQFPFESIVTIKDYLCIACRRMADPDVREESLETLQTSPSWLPTTYNLETELPQFVSYFQHREKLQMNNHWIVKPWNLARALDTHVSTSLHHILRVKSSGPKIVQKYIENPVLFDRPGIGLVKFDIRYIILLRRVAPLQVSVYNRFWLRFANVPFSLDKCDIYEKHFTVMNYTPGAHLEQMFCNVFVEKFEAQNPGCKWVDVQDSIFRMFRDIFEGATKLPGPQGISESPQSRAMYAADVMLQWENEEKTKIGPRILEINWGPDCKRACDYYPDFFDNVFSHLFFDEIHDQNVTCLE